MPVCAATSAIKICFFVTCFFDIRPGSTIRTIHLRTTRRGFNGDSKGFSCGAKGLGGSGVHPNLRHVACTSAPVRYLNSESLTPMVG